MIGVRAKRRVPPGFIDRGWTSPAPAAELRDPAVENGDVGEIVRERTGGKVWEASRGRESPNVDDKLDSV